MARSLLVAVAVAPLLGCAATLTDAIKVRAPEAFLLKKTAVLEKQVGGQTRCVREVTVEVAYLPGGSEYEVNFNRGFLASNEFSVHLHESGTLKQVSLNSDPQVDETLTAIGGLAEKIAGAVAAVSGPQAVSAFPAGAPCVPSVSTKLAPLVCFLDPKPETPEGVCPDDPGAW